jgi:hypothetical protein
MAYFKTTQNDSIAGLWANIRNQSLPVALITKHHCLAPPNETSSHFAFFSGFVKPDPVVFLSNLQEK